MALVTYGSLTRPYVTDGAPTSGTSGSFAGTAQIGAFLVRSDTGAWYTNTNTVASPTWTPIPTTISANLDDGAVANVAASNVLGGIPVVFRFDLAAGALADTDITVTHKIRVIDAHLVLQGAGVATTTLTVKNGTSAITNAMAASGSDQALVRATSLDDANWDVAAGGTLRVTSATGATQPAATVFVTAIRVA